jgi:hypothetical protein
MFCTYAIMRFLDLCREPPAAAHKKLVDFQLVLIPSFVSFSQRRKEPTGAVKIVGSRWMPSRNRVEGTTMR